MKMYTRDYTFLYGEHYKWRHFKCSVITDKGLVRAESSIDKIMETLFNGCEVFFKQGEMHESKYDGELSESWKVVNIMNPPLKYPKTQTWGEYKNGVISPIDWKVKGR